MKWTNLSGVNCGAMPDRATASRRCMSIDTLHALQADGLSRVAAQEQELETDLLFIAVRSYRHRCAGR